MSSLTKSTITITILNALGTAFAFFSNVVIAGVFGAGLQMDIYLAATTLPFFIISIIGGSLNITFIPVFAEYRSNNDSNIWKVVSSILNLNILFTIILAVIVIIEASPIMHLLAPGFSNEKIEMATILLRWQILIIILAVINELMASIYYSNQRFVVPLLNKIISPSITIIYVLLFHSSMNIKSLVFATITGMLIQTLLLSLRFKKYTNFKYYFDFDYKNPGVIKVFKLMIPLIGGMLFYKIIPLFDRFLASKLPEGNISHLGYSFKIYSQLPAIISAGISLSLFPFLADLASKNDLEGIRNSMSKGIRIMFFISIPFVFIFVLYGYYIIDLIFDRGAFTSYDSLMTSKALTFYILALPMAVMGDIIGKGYYIFQDTITPVIIGIFETFIYFVLAYVFFPKYGFLSMPIAYAIYFNFSCINAFVVRKKLGGNGGKTIIISFLKHLLSAIIVFGIIFLLTNRYDTLLWTRVLPGCIPMCKEWGVFSALLPHWP